MGIHVVYPFAVCNADHFEKFNRTIFDLFLGFVFVFMKERDFIHLITDLKNGIERGHRLLKDHGHEVPAQMLHGLLRCLCDLIDLISCVQTNGALHHLSLRTLQKLHERETGHGLAAAGFSHYPNRLSHRHVEGDAVHTLHRAGIRVKIGMQVFEFDGIVLVPHLR